MDAVDDHCVVRVAHNAITAASTTAIASNSHF
jgi:hypothetical protein